MYEVETLEPSDHKLIGDIIADSFSDDALNLWIFGSATSIKSYFSLAAKKLYLKKGFGHIVRAKVEARGGEQAKGVLSGMGGTLWLPPSVSKHIPAWNSLDIAFHMLRHSGLKSISRGMKVDQLLRINKPKPPHYYLYCIGSRKAHQGLGVGSALLRKGLERVDREKMPVYLESSKESNIPYYQRFGFEVVDRLIAEDTCPPIFPMWRAPID